MDGSIKVMLDLRSVTLMAATTRDVVETIKAMDRCAAFASFAERVLFSPVRPEGFNGHWIECPKFLDTRELCPWSMTVLPRIAQRFTAHVLSVHWDGFIIDPTAWQPEFLTYDFIGAPVMESQPKCPRPATVPFEMNNGFYLSSRKFWKALGSLQVEPSIEYCHPSDRMVTGTLRPQLEAKGIKYAPLSLAQKFACTETPWEGEFGAHSNIGLRGAPLHQPVSDTLLRYISHGTKNPEPRGQAYSPVLGVIR